MTKKSEHILQDEESIVLQEFCYYCRDGLLAKRKLGNVILTNKRFIILKSAIPKASFAVIVIPIVIVVGILIDSLPKNMEFLWKVLITAISGGMIGRISSAISKHLIKNKWKVNEAPSGEIIVSIAHENIAGAEKKNKGFRKILLVKLKDETLYKISVKDKDRWQTELSNQIQDQSVNLVSLDPPLNKRDLRIVFMGTPEFAVESLRALVEGGYSVAGVVTAPDKPVGKHQSVLQASAVKQYALSQNLPLLQPEKLKDAEFIEQLRTWNADLQIVVAFRMLPEVVWNMPRWGTFNLHASLLPQYRGAAPINWAVINGEQETGVTTFFLTHEIDTGKIIFHEKIPIADTDNAGDIHDRLMHLGAGLVVKTVDAILENAVHPVPQSELMNGETLKPAPKIFKDTCCIRWNQAVKTIYDFIRGLAPYPGAWTELTTSQGNTLNFKIFETEKIIQAHDLPPGNIVSDGKKQFDISAIDGFIRVKNLQQTGKKRMNVEDFLRGMRI